MTGVFVSCGFRIDGNYHQYSQAALNMPEVQEDLQFFADDVNRICDEDEKKRAEAKRKEDATTGSEH